jgi:hypothetical protein
MCIPSIWEAPSVLRFVIFTPELTLQFMEPVQQKVSAKYLLLVEENSRTKYEAEEYDYIHIWPQVVVGFQVTMFFFNEEEDE